MEGEVQFKWSLLDVKQMDTWNSRLCVGKEYYMSRYYKGRCPLLFRVLYKIPYFFRRFNQRVIRLEIGQ